MNRRGMPHELRRDRGPVGLRGLCRGLRWLAIGAAVVLVATAAIPAVGVLIAALFWLLLAAVLGIAGVLAAGPVRRAATVVAGVAMTAARWFAAHSPRWLLALLAGRLRRSRRRRRALVPAIALPRVPVAALPSARDPRDGERWEWAA